MKPRLIIILGALLLIAVIVIALLTVFSGRSNQNSSPKLTIWSPFDEESTYKEISKPFLDANPGIELDFKYIVAKDAKEYESKVVDAIASGAGPDIWLMRNDWLAKHQSKLSSSAAYLRWGSDRKLSTKDDGVAYFGESVFAQNSRNGELYGYPLSLDSLALFINSDVFSQVRRELEDQGDARSELFGKKVLTWSDVEKLSQLITKKDSKGNITRSGIALGTVGNTYAPVDAFLAILGQSGGQLYTEDESQVGLHLTRLIDNDNRAPGLEALTLTSGFARPGSADYTWNSTLGSPLTAFANGKLAMFVGYSSATLEIRKINKEFTNYTIAALPQVNDPEITGKRVDYAAYWTHTVSKASTHPDLAWAYLKSLSTDAIRVYSKQTGKPVLSVETADTIDNGTANDPNFFANQALNSPAVFKPDWQTTDEIVQDMLNQATLTNQSLQGLIDSASEQLKALLKTDA